MRLLRCGDAAVLVELGPGDPVAHELATALRVPGTGPGLEDVVPAERSVLVRFDPARTTVEAVADLLATVAGPTRTGRAPEPAVGPPEVTLTVDYDGEDLETAAALAGLTPQGLVEAHTAATWTVLFCGFAPGFGYLRCADRRLDLPRREVSRPRVPAGAVALAAGYTGVYPRSSPGGWQLIGRTDAPLWSLERDPPALLRPGVRVRFVAGGG